MLTKLLTYLPRYKRSKTKGPLPNLTLFSAYFAFLYFIAPPYVRPFSFGDQNFFGDSAEIQCSANGDTPIKISWTFQSIGFGAALNKLNGVEITKTGQKSSVLSIDSLTAENSGNYTVCQNSYNDIPHFE